MTITLHRRVGLARWLCTLLTCALAATGLTVGARPMEAASHGGANYVGVDSVDPIAGLSSPTGQLHDDQSRKNNFHKGHRRSFEPAKTLFVAPVVSRFSPRVVASVRLDSNQRAVLNVPLSQIAPRAPPVFFL